jgi:hypothetical protein
MLSRDLVPIKARMRQPGADRQAAAAGLGTAYDHCGSWMLISQRGGRGARERGENPQHPNSCWAPIGQELLSVIVRSSTFPKAVRGLRSVVQLSCLANSALHSHRAPGPANLFSETGPWRALSSWSGFWPVAISIIDLASSLGPWGAWGSFTPSSSE